MLEVYLERLVMQSGDLVIQNFHTALGVLAEELIWNSKALSCIQGPYLTCCCFKFSDSDACCNCNTTNILQIKLHNTQTIYTNGRKHF